MKSGTPSFVEVINGLIKAALIEIHTAMPGRVVSYDKKKQVATIQPIIRKTATVRIPAIPGVSVMFQGNDVCSIAWPVKKGDTGLLVFSESSLDKWKTGGGDDVDPGDARRFDLSDALFIPALRSGRKPIPSSAIHDTAMVIMAPEVHIGGDKALVTKEEFMLHTHPDPTSGTTGTPTSTITGTTKLKGG